MSLRSLCIPSDAAWLEASDCNLSDTLCTQASEEVAVHSKSTIIQCFEIESGEGQLQHSVQELQLSPMSNHHSPSTIAL